MLFWLFIILIIIGVVALHLSFEYDLVFISALSLVTGAIGLVVSVAFLLGNYSNASGYTLAMRERYNILVYQLENDIYDNDNDLGKRNLYKEIQEWNEELAWYQEAQDSFWLGIYIPNVYDMFEFIELK